MVTQATNLISLEKVSKAYGVRPLLTDVSLGIQRGDRVGIVGRNGDGKTTLLRILAGVEPVDAGRATRTRSLRLGLLAQQDARPGPETIAGVVLGGLAEHEWAADPQSRGVVAHLLSDLPLDRRVDALSGGELRRVRLAQLLLTDLDVLLLDEPTNHFDIDAVAWLAAHLVARDVTLVVVTHDRWFLDAVAASTWEVHDATVDGYDGGYAAYVLAKAERMRQAESAEVRRQNLMRKELAWLRRGAPARTSKPKFRIDAASTLIADEPAPRDGVELQRFAATRLGKDVLDLEDATIARGERKLVDHVTWRIGPGERIGLIGANGSGKTSVLSVLAGESPPHAGLLRVGRTVRLGRLSQGGDDLDAQQGVLSSVEAVKRIASVGSGREVTATSMLERFGLTGDKLTARVGDLSGGERRRLQLLLVLLDEPNVLLLDEPTNDLDIETLTVVEDYLDGWPGTLVVVSHDRYFLERVCDTIRALPGDASLVMVPGGVDDYLARRAAARASAGQRGAGSGGGPSGQSGRPTPPVDPTGGPVTEAGAAAAGAARAARAVRKEVTRIDRQLGKLADRIAAVHASMAEHPSDFERQLGLGAELRGLEAERDALEDAWLEAAELLG